MDKGRVITLTAGLVGLAVFTFAWSTALYIMLGFSIEVVRPWSVFEYISAYGIGGGNLGLLGTSFLIACAVAALVAGALWLSKPKTYYGDARWAYHGELVRAGLLDTDGILLGRKQSTFVRNGGAGHVLVAAPTRSGKGVGIVIPNLLSWPGSAVVLDIKHENHATTSGFRAQHQQVFKWSPADDESKSHRFNPLSTIRDDPAHRISDLQRLATILLPQPVHADPMWQNEARDLFLGLALYVLDDPALPSTIGQIYRVLKSEHDVTDIIEHLLQREDLHLDSSARMSLGSFINKAVKERSGVRSNLTAALNLWANPVIDAATATSDFELADLRRRPMTVYVGVKQNQLDTLAPILGLFFQQCVDVLGRDLPGKDEPHRVLMLIDEFASLGRLPVIESAMAFLAGYNVRLLNIIQGLSQLDHHYGPAKDSILQNSGIQVYFAPNDDQTAGYVSHRLGTKTIRTASRSDPGGFGWATKTTGYASRDFMLPEQIRQLKDTEQIVFKEGARPAKTKKIRYYADKQFKNRLQPPAPVPSLSLEGHPIVSVPAAQTAQDDDWREDRDVNDLAEATAVATEIADLMAADTNPETRAARDELLAVIEQDIEP